MSKHATVRTGGMVIPLISIKPTETQEKCDKCQKQVHVQEITLIDGKFICNNCKPQTKESQ